METANVLTIILALLSLVLAAAAVLPGSLGVFKFTHKFTARAAGAFFTYVVSAPLYALSVALLVLSLYLTVDGRGSWAVALPAVVIFAGISIFGFLMHTRFMFRPVRAPHYISIDEAIERFGESEEVIGVVDRQGRPFAYMARLARRPHIVYQPDGDAPFIMSHCILSHSSMAYEVNETFRPDRIYISSVLANNLVFYDKAAHCSVLQIYHRSPEGGDRLQCLPTVMTSLASWKRLYPESKVWVRPKEWRDTFYLKLLARASVIDPQSPDLVYPLEHEPDPRLPLKAYVLGVEIGGQAKAYPVELFRNNRIIEDVVDGEPVVFFGSEDGDLIQLFSRQIEKNQVLRFQAAPDDRFQDLETSSIWSQKGLCLAGELEGTQLKPIPHYNKIFWCVWYDFYPSTAVCEARTEART